MDDNVMKKYTRTSHEARHYVQYDQGEDRWLCTLLLQRGYRVEYSAASDAYTHCPKRFDEFFNQRRRWVPSVHAFILSEDRWLCTLLLQRGYRVEYSAASDAYTHCPERFDEFFNQRRRWVPSTMANILDLLVDYKSTVRVNDNISTLYIVYQMFLMVGTVLGPGTIFLMLVGAMNAITGMSIMNSLLLNLVPVALFLLVCMTCKSEIQLMLAQAITCLYAMLMMMVIVGIVLQIVEDGWLAPSSIFTVVTFGSFFITAAMHPQEIICLVYLAIYYITIPSMYMLLIIYSLCNLNNVSWGTREVAQKKTAKQMEQEKKELEEAAKKVEAHGLAKWLGGNKSDETSGTFEFSINGLFKFICCTNPNDHKEDYHLLKIANSLEKMEKRLDTLGAEGPPEPSQLRRRSSMGLRSDTMPILPEYEPSEDSSDIPREERDDLINPYWIEDPNLSKGEVDFLTTAETEFWKDLIDAYLRPIDENKEELDRIKTDLKNLRDTMVFAFVMLNSLFVLVIFLLQLNQDQIFIRWPLGQDVTIGYEDDNNIVRIEQDFLTLEPIGSLFLIFFGSVMIVQFTAMMFHRMGTLTHLLSTVQLNWYCTRQPEDMSEEALLDKHAIEIAKDLQRLNDDDLKNGKVNDDHVSRRKTIHNLEKSRDNKQSVANLDVNFKRRMTILQQNDPEAVKRVSSMLPSNIGTRRATLRALTARRSSVAEKRASQAARESMSDLYAPRVTLTESRQTSGAYPRSSTTYQRASHAYPRSSIAYPRASTAYVNKAYEPAFDSDDDDTPQMPRRSTVRFKDTYA
ncbi:chitin synthase domain-containing protein [Phthorimaea operculella]|nr:chitin synthase domain-containing protein [Phthorimaea operculella]